MMMFEMKRIKEALWFEKIKKTSIPMGEQTIKQQKNNNDLTEEMKIQIYFIVL